MDNAKNKVDSENDANASIHDLLDRLFNEAPSSASDDAAAVPAAEQQRPIQHLEPMSDDEWQTAESRGEPNEDPHPAELPLDVPQTPVDEDDWDTVANHPWETAEPLGEHNEDLHPAELIPDVPQTPVDEVEWDWVDEIDLIELYATAPPVAPSDQLPTIELDDDLEETRPTEPAAPTSDQLPTIELDANYEETRPTELAAPTSNQLPTIELDADLEETRPTEPAAPTSNQLPTIELDADFEETRPTEPATPNLAIEETVAHSIATTKSTTIKELQTPNLMEMVNTLALKIKELAAEINSLVSGFADYDADEMSGSTCYSEALSEESAEDRVSLFESDVSLPESDPSENNEGSYEFASDDEC